MKNTLENKAKFFTQYWGQKVRCWDTGSPKELGVVGPNFIVKPYLIKTHLQLKTLSSITDEDSMRVAYILGFDNEAMVHQGKLFVDRIMGKRAGNSQDNCYLTYKSMEACDFLRSKGYALPFMGKSIEALVKYGWIKIF